MTPPSDATVWILLLQAIAGVIAFSWQWLRVKLMWADYKKRKGIENGGT